MQSVTLEIQNKLGLHARAAAKFVKVASQFDCKITVSKIGGDDEVSGKSILGLMTLAAEKGSKISVLALNQSNSEEEIKTIEAISELVNSKFGED